MSRRPPRPGCPTPRSPSPKPANVRRPPAPPSATPAASRPRCWVARVALALIPEVISFSIIAGVDPQVGLLSSFVMAVTIATVILAGILQIIPAALGVAKLMRFIPRMVMVGFVNALAILIFLARSRTWSASRCSSTRWSPWASRDPGLPTPRDDHRPRPTRHHHRRHRRRLDHRLGPPRRRRPGRTAPRAA